MCDCIDTVNEQLRVHGIQVQVGHSLGGRPRRTVVQTTKADDPGKRPPKSAPVLYATFCPFCGTSLER